MNSPATTLSASPARAREDRIAHAILLTRFSTFLQAQQLSKISIKNYLSDLRRFLTYWQNENQSDKSIQLDSVESAIRAYRSMLLASATPLSTLNRKFASLKQFSLYLEQTHDRHIDQTLLTRIVTTPKKNEQEREPSPNESALHQFASALADEGCSHETIQNYTADVHQFMEFAQEQILASNQTKPQLVSFFSHLEKAGFEPATMRRKSASLKKFYIWAKNSGYLLASPYDSFFRKLVDHAIVQVRRFTPLAFFERARKSRNEHAVLEPSASKKPRSLYQLYSEWPVSSYLHLGVLIIFVILLSLFGYQQFFVDAEKKLAYPSSLTTPNRVLSFQGRLTDSAQTPIVIPTNTSFRLFSVDSGGTALWDSSTCSVDPDQDGIFSVLLGSDCGGAIASSVFTENQNVYLEVVVSGETLAPRQQIATVGYALNSETLQGYPASASAVENTVLVMNNSGDVILGSSAPNLKATSDSTFTIEGTTLALLTTAGTGGGDITIQPDSSATTGQVNFLGSTTTEDFISISNSALTTGNLIDASVGNANTGYNFLSFSGGSSPVERFAVNALGGVTAASYIQAPGATFSATYAGGTPLTVQGGPSGTANLMDWKSGAGSTLGVINSAGNVGIGTTSPSTALHVAGATGLTLGFDAATNTAGTLKMIGTGANDYYTTFTTGTQTANATYTLPTAMAGGTGYVLTGNTAGEMSWTAPGSVATKWNAITSPDGAQTLTMANYATTWNWDTLSTGTGLTIGSTSLSSGSLASLSVSGTNAASNTQKALNITTSGANGTATQTTYGLYATNTHTGTTSTNIAGYFSASGGTTNYGLYSAGGENYFAGNVGMGITNPGSKLEVVGGGYFSSSTALTTNLTTSWTNNGSFAYETFTSSGANITQAVNSTGYGIANANTTSLTPQKVYKVTFTLTQNSGSRPIFFVSTSGTGGGSGIDPVWIAVTPSGDNSYTFKVPTSASYAPGFRTETGVASDFTISNFQFREITDALTVNSSLVTNNLELKGLITSAGGSSGISLSHLGNVGIGSTTPAGLLHLRSSTPYLFIEDTVNTGTKPVGALTVGADASNKSNFTFWQGATTTNIITAGNERFSFGEDYVYLQSNTTPNLYINNSGNVGIGTTTPGYMLEVGSGDLNLSTGTVRMAGADYGQYFIDSAGTNNYVWASDASGRGTWADPSVLTSANNYWQLNAEQIAPKNALWHDLMVGGTATSSAKFYAQANTGNGYFAGNVGIGVTSPVSKLDVRSTSDLSTIGVQLSLVDDTTAAQGVGGIFNLGGKYNSSGGVTSFASLQGIKENATDSNYAGSLVFYTRQAGSGGWNVVGQEKMRITSTGNVGIGTTTPLALLDVAGNASTAGTLSFRGTTDPKINVLNGENFGIRTSAGGDAGLSEKITVLAGGNVGVGTTGPGALLDVNGAAIFRGSASVDALTVSSPTNNYLALNTTGIASFKRTGTNPSQQNAGLQIFNTDSQAADKGGFIQVGGAYTGTNVTPFGGFGAFKTNSIDGDYSGYFSFYSRNNGSIPTERMRIDNIGNVGIGTTSPDYALQVNGVIAPETTDQDLGTTSLRWDVYGNILNADSTVTLSGLGSGTGTSLCLDGSNNVVTCATGGSSNYWQLNAQQISPVNALWHDLMIGGTATSSAKFYAQANTGNGYFGGNVGVGTTSPSDALHVVADSGTALSNLASFTGGGTDGDKNQIQIGATRNSSGNSLVVGHYVSSTSGADYGYLGLYGATDTLILRSGGNVGIGTTTPTADFEVYNANYGTVHINGANGGLLRFQKAGTTTWGLISDYSGGGAGTLSFYNYDAGYTGIKMLLSQTGNVGIGTTTPSELLQVGTGSTNTTRRAIRVGSSYALNIQNYTNNSGDSAFFQNAYVEGGSGITSTYKWVTTHASEFGSRGIEFNYGTQAYNGIKFYADSVDTTADASFTPTQRMIINNAGSVGIGVTNPTYQLDVNSTGTYGTRTVLTTSSIDAIGQNTTVTYSGVNTAASGVNGSYTALTNTAQKGSFSFTLRGTRSYISNTSGIADNLYGGEFYSSNSSSALSDTGKTATVSAGINAFSTVSAGSIVNSFGVDAYSQNTSATSTIDISTGSRSRSSVTAGTLTTSYGAQALSYTYGGNIGTSYGLYVRSYENGSGTITGNSFGIYLADTGGTTQYGLYQSGTDDINYFAGNVGIG
ncbi:MAG TPA: hypothetical protein DCW55_03820, partial [Candidatus Pacebacteria bacterium]|nr:hypothetical protein [Candidatus Paceibacterota bacterium]HAX01951.1 hypothetical protein [Candidatus Paceibacterota bacterium]